MSLVQARGTCCLHTGTSTGVAMSEDDVMGEKGGDGERGGKSDMQPHQLQRQQTDDCVCVFRSGETG